MATSASSAPRWCRSYEDPLAIRSSSLINATTSLHGILLPCASLASDTTHACCASSRTIVTSAFSAVGGDAALDAGPSDCDPHAAIRIEAAAKTKDLRTLMSTPTIIAHSDSEPNHQFPQVSMNLAKATAPLSSARATPFPR